MLTLNAGSSTLKFALFDPSLRPLLRGVVDDLEHAPSLSASDASGRSVVERHDLQPDGAASIIRDLLDFTLAYSGDGGLGCVGHRIVHGGPDYATPVRIDADALAALDRLTPLDPLHMPGSLAPVRAIAAAQPSLPQIACFDTAFHHTLPREARTVAVPREYRDAGLRRYGFHGLSYEYVAAHLARTAPDLARGRVIVAHLGSGASLCAMQGGVSIATTMGFSVLDGLVMATRCGSIDPGAILWLARQGHAFEEIEDMLYRRSGLLGVSGISGDMRVLLDSDDPRAAEAIDLFTYRIAVEAGGLATALGGVDGLVFTGGIGEHSPEIRARVSQRLDWLGLHLDAAANGVGAACISGTDSKIDVRVIPTDEEMTIARHALSVVAA
ncbi:acetate/propionate family kinase [Sphingomonas sp. IW22]|uniref:acetate/propionate family kinase n=1 Tax=Sphingomonas sp. IW22 TaxID=3242489 RepID=UPI0035207960